MSAPLAVERVNILGVGISILHGMEHALSLVLEAAHTPGFAGYVTSTGVHGIVESQDDVELKRIHNRSFLSLPDGVPTVWLGRLRGHRRMRQVAGADFMPTLLQRTALGSGERHFFWGGGVGVAARLERALRRKFPGAHIVACTTPPFRPLTSAEEEALLGHIERTRPHFFWVGLGTPKQERFMAGFLSRHAARLWFSDQGFLMFGFGAVFDFQAGTAKEAPPWIRGSGFEWLYRLLHEPRRLGPRYLRINPRFVLGVFSQLLRPERFPLVGEWAPVGTAACHKQADP